MIAESDLELLKTEFGRKVHDLDNSGNGPEAYNVWLGYMEKRNDQLTGNDATIRQMIGNSTTK